MKKSNTYDDSVVSKDSLKARTRLIFFVCSVSLIVLLLGRQISGIMQVIKYGKHPDQHPAWQMSNDALNAIESGDYKWLIDHANTDEVVRDGLTPELLRKVVDITRNDPGNGLIKVPKVVRPNATTLPYIVTPLKSLSSIENSRYYLDKQDRLFKLQVVIVVDGNRYWVRNILWSLIGGAQMRNYSGQTRQWSSIHVISPKQISELESLGIRSVHVYDGRFPNPIPTSEIPKLQRENLWMVGDDEHQLIPTQKVR